MSDLKWLAVDVWYKALIVVGVAVLVLGLTVPLQLPNRAVILIGLGAAAHGIGQWMNHPLQTRVVGVYKITAHHRRVSFWGVAWELAGLGLAGLGIYILLV